MKSHLLKRVVLMAALLVAGHALADIVAPQPTTPLPAPAPAPAPAAPPAPAVHPEGIEKAAPTGVIQGGWGYVYACYGIAIGGTIFYALTLFLRRPRGPQGSPS